MRSITDMLRKERKLNRIKQSIKTIKGRKCVRQKQEQRTRATKTNSNKYGRY